MRRQFFLGYPTDCRAAQGARFGLGFRQSAAEETQVNRFLRIRVRQAFHQILHDYVNSKFLPEFTVEAILERLARFTLAAGELPEPGEVGCRAVAG